MSSFEKWSHWMDIAIFRTVDVGVTRAYDVLKKAKIFEREDSSATFMDKNKESNECSGTEWPKNCREIKCRVKDLLKKKQLMRYILNPNVFILKVVHTGWI